MQTFPLSLGTPLVGIIIRLKYANSQKCRDIRPFVMAESDHTTPKKFPAVRKSAMFTKPRPVTSLLNIMMARSPITDGHGL